MKSLLTIGGMLVASSTFSAQPRVFDDTCTDSRTFALITSEIDIGSELDTVLTNLEKIEVEHYEFDKKTMDSLLDRHRDEFHFKVVIVTDVDTESSIFSTTELVSVGFNNNSEVIRIECNLIHTGP